MNVRNIRNIALVDCSGRRSVYAHETDRVSRQGRVRRDSVVQEKQEIGVRGCEGAGRDDALAPVRRENARSLTRHFAATAVDVIVLTVGAIVFVDVVCGVIDGVMVMLGVIS